MKGLSIGKALRLLLRKGIGIHDTPAEIRRQIDGLQEQKEALATRRDELSKRFYRLSGEYSTLRYQYHEAFIENRSLAMHLCGRGLADKYSDLVDRYIFTKLY
jgi:predicted nuclease with TOPRIM domain